MRPPDVTLDEVARVILTALETAYGSEFTGPPVAITKRNLLRLRLHVRADEDAWEAAILIDLIRAFEIPA